MAYLVQLIKVLSVLAGAVLLGQWFLAEVKKARRQNRPWFSPYLTPPGLLVLAALVLPLAYWLWRR